VPAPTPADFGFNVSPLNLPLAVNTVEPGSIAAAAGVHPGDQLVTIDGAPLQGVLPAGAMVLLMNHKPGSTATLGLVHGGIAQTIKLTAPTP
jgi:C-terminal processing protease CtpA/Prc